MTVCYTYSEYVLCYTGAESCGGVFEQESGTIDYPPGDSNYGYNEFCTWLVILPDPSKRVVVNVTEFDVYYYPKCDYNYLRVSVYYIHAIKTCLDYKFSDKLFVKK